MSPWNLLPTQSQWLDWKSCEFFECVWPPLPLSLRVFISFFWLCIFFCTLTIKNCWAVWRTDDAYCDNFVFVCVGEHGPTLKCFAVRLQRTGLKLGEYNFFFFYSYPAKTVESSHTVLRRVFQADSRWLSAQTKHSAAWVSSPAGNKARPRLTSLHACARALHLYPLSPVQQM